MSNQETMTTIMSAKHTAVGTIVKGYNKSVITIVLQLLIRTISANYIDKANGFIVMLSQLQTVHSYKKHSSLTSEIVNKQNLCNNLFNKYSKHSCTFLLQIAITIKSSLMKAV